MASDSDDVFSSDSDSSFEDLQSYNASSDKIFDTYFDRTTKQTSSLRSPLYQVDPTGSPVPIHDTSPCSPSGNHSSSNLSSPLRRRDAKWTPPRPQPEYTLFPAPEPRAETQPLYTNPQHHSLPARSDSLLGINITANSNNNTQTRTRTRTRARAYTTPSVPSSTNSSHLALSNLSTTHSAPVSPQAEISSFDHDDDEDDRPAWRKALHIRTGASVEKEIGEQPKSSLRKKAKSASQHLKDVFKKKAASPV